jgi:DNA-directed RNA polymerase subunit RPC12/RpoP
MSLGRFVDRQCPQCLAKTVLEKIVTVPDPMAAVTGVPKKAKAFECQHCGHKWKEDL